MEVVDFLYIAGNHITQRNGEISYPSAKRHRTVPRAA